MSRRLNWPERRECTKVPKPVPMREWMLSTLRPTSTTSIAIVVSVLRVQMVCSPLPFWLRRLSFGRVPSVITARITSGKTSTCQLYSPPSAPHSENQASSDSVVQNDHSTQMNQKVP